MAILRGVDVLFYIPGEPDTPIGGQRNATLSISGDSIDTTAKDTGDWRTFLAGLKSWTLSCDGVYADADPGILQLENAFFSGDVIDVKLAKDTEWTATGQAIITSLDYDASLEDVMTLSIELQGTGALTVS
ncbi:MAG: phage major tail protein, TP901-1 family [Candidatus Freyarchaeota archaeon]